MQDPIVDEIRRVRDEHAAKFNYDINAIFADLKRLELERNLLRVSFGPRLISEPLSVQPTPSVNISGK